MRIEILLRQFWNLHIKISMENWLFIHIISHLPGLCHFIQLWKITPFFYNNFSGFGGGGLPPSHCGRPWLRNSYIFAIFVIFELFVDCYIARNASQQKRIDSFLFSCFHQHLSKYLSLQETLKIWKFACRFDMPSDLTDLISFTKRHYSLIFYRKLHIWHSILRKK